MNLSLLEYHRTEFMAKTTISKHRHLHDSINLSHNENKIPFTNCSHKKIPYT